MNIVKNPEELILKIIVKNPMDLRMKFIIRRQIRPTTSYNSA